MIKFNKKFLISIFTGITATISAISCNTLGYSSSLLQYNDAVTSARNSSYTIYLGQDDSSLSYSHDEYCFDGRNENGWFRDIMISGNDWVRDNINAINNCGFDSGPWNVAMRAYTNAGFTFETRQDSCFVNNKDVPGWYPAIIYRREDNRPYANIKNNDWAANGEMVNRNNRLFFDSSYNRSSDGGVVNGSKNGYLFSSGSYLGGGVKINIPWWWGDNNSSNTPSWHQVGVRKPNEKASSIYQLSSSYSWANYNKQYGSGDTYSWPYWTWSFENTSGNGWRTSTMSFYVFDNTVYFTWNDSSISSIKVDTSRTIDDYKRSVANGQTTGISISLYNTPKCVIQNSSGKDSYLSITFDDDAEQMRISMTVPRNFSPRYTRRNISDYTDTSIRTSGMSNSVTIPYSSFPHTNTSWKASTSTPINIADLDGNSWSNTNVFDLTTQQVKEIIVRHISTFFNNMPSSLSTGYLNVSISNQNYNEGSVYINCSTSYGYHNGVLRNHTDGFSVSGSAKLTGLKIVRNTVWYPTRGGDLVNSRKWNVNSTSYGNTEAAKLRVKNVNQVSLDDLKVAIVDARGWWFDDMPSGLTVNNLDVKITNRNPITGEIEFTCYSNFGNYGGRTGTLSTRVGGRGIVSGLVKLPATGFVAPSGNIDGRSTFGTQYATSSISDSAIQQFIFNHNSSFITGMVDGTSASNIVSITKTPNIKAGTMQVTFNLNKYLNSSGVYVDSSGSTTLGPSPTYTISGFKQAQDTAISKTINLTTIKSIRASNAEANKATIITAIKNSGAITNTAFDRPLTDADIQIQFLNDTANDVNGSIQANITIANKKSWTNGIEDTTKVFNNITISGFEQIPATEWAANKTVSIPSDDFFAGVTSNFVDNESLKLFVSEHPSEFVVNPLNGKLSDDQFDVAIIPASIQNPADGSLRFTLTLKKYVDGSTGKIVDGSNPSLYRTQEFTITGFYNTDLTTIIDDSHPVDSTLSSILPSQVIGNASYIDTLKQAFIDANIVTGVPFGEKLKKTDIIITPTMNEANDVKGTLVTLVTINHSNAWVNGDFTDVSKTITFNGFDTALATRFNTNTTSDLVSGSELINVPTNLVTNPQIKEYVKANSDSFVINPLGGTLTDEQFDVQIITDSTTNPATGSLQFKIILKQYMDEATGLPVNGTDTSKNREETFTLNGFYKGSQTTEMSNMDIDVADTLGSTKASEAAAITNNPQLVAAVLNKGNITGLQPTKTLQASDITVTTLPDNYNDADGSLTADVTISANVAWKNAEKQAVTFNGVRFHGFKKVAPTEFVTPPTLVNGADTFSAKYADQVNEADVRAFIYAHASSFYINPVEGMTADNIVDIHFSSNMTEGNITVTFKLNKYIDKTGRVIDGTLSDISPTYTIEGFKKAVGETTIKSNSITLDASVNDLLPLDITNANDAAKTKIITALIAIPDLFSNVAYGATVEAGNLTITNIRSQSNLTGSIVADIVLGGNKYWNNGTTSSTHTYSDITLKGFRQNIPTTFKNDVPELSASSDISNNQATSQQVTETMLKEFIANNINKLVDNSSSDITADNVLIEGTPTYNTGTGSISLTYRLNKFIDENGVEISDGSKTTEVSPLLTITGFSTEGITTLTPSAKLSGLDQDLASSVVTTDEAMMNKIKAAIAPTITNVVNKGTIDPITDLEINGVATANDVAGSLAITYTIKNNKYWDKGVIQDNKQITQTYTGFKKLIATDFVNPTTNINGSKVFGNMYASDEVDDELIKQFIIDNHEQFIVGMVDGTDKNNIVELTKTPNVQNGTMDITFKLNKYLDKTTGTVVNGTDTTRVSPKFTISGFKNTDLTTTIVGTNLADMGGVLPSSVKANDATIIAAIIKSGSISNIAYGKELQTSDISYTIDSYDNIKGTLTLIVTIGGNKYWNNGSIENNKVMSAVTYTGFNHSLETTFVTDKNITDTDAFGSKQATDVQVNVDFVKDYIVGHLDSFINNKVPGTNGTNIKNVTIKKYNTADGTIEVSFDLDTYTSSTGQLVTPGSGTTLPSGTFILGGFDTNGLTTEITEGTLNLSDLEPESLKTSDEAKQKLIDAIIAKGWITNLANRQTLDKSNVKITDVVSANNVTGEATVEITIGGRQAWTNGAIDETKVFTVSYSGLGITIPTKWVSKTTIDGREVFGSFQATDAIKPEQLAQFVADHENLFFTNGLGKITADNVKVKTPLKFDPTNGSITFSFGLNQYINSKGEEITPDMTGSPLFDSPEFTITGFDTNGLTTVLLDGELSGVKNIVPSSISSNEDLKLQVCNAIAPTITGTAYKKPISGTDLTLDITKYNDVTGTITANVTINNSLAWDNGVVTSDTKQFTGLTFGGFKATPATTFSTVTAINDPSLSDIASNTYSDEQLQAYVFKHKEKFIINEVPSMQQSDIVIKDKTFRLVDGTVSFKIGLKKYLNDDGQLILNGTDGGTPGLKVSPEFTLSGFLNGDVFTTSIDTNSISLQGVNHIFANQVANNDINIKNALLPQLKLHVKNLNNRKDPSTLSTADFDYTVVKDSTAVASGNLKIIVTLKNNTAWVAGVTKERYALPEITISGFKTDALTTIATSSTINVSGDFSTITAAQFTTNTSAQDQLKAIIVNEHKIINLTDGATTLKVSDITLTNIKVKDQFAGTVSLTVNVINDMAWENGTAVASKPFDFTISGFKPIDKATTSFSDFDINTHKDAIFGDNKFFTIDWNDASAVTNYQNQFSNYINTHLNEFIKNTTINGITASVNSVTLTIDKVNNMASFSVTFNNCVVTAGGTGTTVNKTYTLNLNATPNLIAGHDVTPSKEEIVKIIEDNTDANGKVNTVAVQAAIRDLIANNVNEILNSINKDNVPDTIFDNKESYINDFKDSISITFNDTTKVLDISASNSVEGFDYSGQSLNLKNSLISQTITGVSNLVNWLPWVILGVLLLAMLILIATRLNSNRLVDKNVKNSRKILGGDDDSNNEAEEVPQEEEQEAAEVPEEVASEEEEDDDDTPPPPPINPDIEIKF